MADRNLVHGLPVDREVTVVGIGAGPSNLALGIALEELAPSEVSADTLLLEQHPDIVWQRGMLLPWTQSQVSFLKDLVTLRNPRSRFSFLNFLHSAGRLDAFINLGTFTPYRAEISAYLQWVADQFQNVQVRYNSCCKSIDALREEPDGPIKGWVVTTQDGESVACRFLSIAAGRDPHVPGEFGGLPRDRVVHSTEYADRVERLKLSSPTSIVVVGAGQSAAELAWAARQQFPAAECTMLMRSAGLGTYETSPFLNELYYPSAADEFFASRPAARQQVLREMRQTNYAGLSSSMLSTLYRDKYLGELVGENRVRLRTLTDVVGARYDAGEVVLDVRARRTGEQSVIRCDLVLLGTGFSRLPPTLVRQLSTAVGARRSEVDANHRVRMPDADTASCYFQGINEETHGISDSLLSVLAIRAERIATEIISDCATSRSTVLATA